MKLFNLFLVFLALSSAVSASPAPENNFKFGDGTAGDKTITANKGAGAANPKLRFKNSTLKWQFSADGVNYVDIGADVIPTVTISASNVDWSLGTDFVKTLGANTTFTFSNITIGKTITITVYNTASNYTLAWPASACWAGGATTCTASAPTLTVGAHHDVFTCKSTNGTTADCNAVQNF